MFWIRRSCLRSRGSGVAKKWKIKYSRKMRPSMQLLTVTQSLQTKRKKTMITHLGKHLTITMRTMWWVIIQKTISKPGWSNLQTWWLQTAGLAWNQLVKRRKSVKSYSYWRITSSFFFLWSQSVLKFNRERQSGCTMLRRNWRTYRGARLIKRPYSSVFQKEISQGLLLLLFSGSVDQQRRSDSSYLDSKLQRSYGQLFMNHWSQLFAGEEATCWFVEEWIQTPEAIFCANTGRMLCTEAWLVSMLRSWSKCWKISYHKRRWRMHFRRGN